MDRKTREHIRRAGERLERKGQTRGKMHSLSGKSCAVGAINKTGRSNYTTHVMDTYCARKWGMGTMKANDMGKLKPHHFAEIAGSGVRHQKAEAKRAKALQAKEVAQQVKQQRAEASALQLPCVDSVKKNTRRVSSSRGGNVRYGAPVPFKLRVAMKTTAIVLSIIMLILVAPYALPILYGTIAASIVAVLSYGVWMSGIGGKTVPRTRGIDQPAVVSVPEKVEEEVDNSPLTPEEDAALKAMWLKGEAHKFVRVNA